MSGWAGKGDGVLFFDADGDGTISAAREYIFTEWDPTAGGDMEALRNLFDTDGDGRLTAADDAFADFRVMVTMADGATQAMTLASLGITAIGLIPDATSIEMPDGSRIDGQAQFTRTDGTTGTIGNAVFERDPQGHAVTQEETFDGSGARTLVTRAYTTDGLLAFSVTSVTSADGLSATVRNDDDGDGVTDRIRTVETTVAVDGTRTETRSDYSGSDLASAALTGRQVVVSSADGSDVTIETDSTGGGWFDSRVERITTPDGSRTTTTTELARDGSIVRSEVQTLTADGMSRSLAEDRDGDGVTETTTSHAIVVAVDLSRTDTSEIRNGDGSLRSTGPEPREPTAWAERLEGSPQAGPKTPTQSRASKTAPRRGTSRASSSSTRSQHGGMRIGSGRGSTPRPSRRRGWRTTARNSEPEAAPQRL